MVTPSRALRIPVLAQRAHAVLDGHRLDLAGIGVADDRVLDVLLGRHELEDADSTGVAVPGALRAADGAPHLSRTVGPGERQVGELVVARRCRARGSCRTAGERGAARAPPATTTRPGTARSPSRRAARTPRRRVVGVDGGEHEVAGERGAARHWLGGLPVADLTDHDHVGVLAQVSDAGSPRRR